MGAVIDAEVLIAAERGAVALDEILDPHERVAIAAVTACELLETAHRTKDPTKRSLRTAIVEQLLERIEVLSFDALAARASAQLKGANGGLAARDLEVAAIALARGWRLVTRRDFDGVPGLEVVKA